MDNTASKLLNIDKLFILKSVLFHYPELKKLFLSSNINTRTVWTKSHYASAYTYKIQLTASLKWLTCKKWSFKQKIAAWLKDYKIDKLPFTYIFNCLYSHKKHVAFVGRFNNHLRSTSYIVMFTEDPMFIFNNFKIFNLNYFIMHFCRILLYFLFMYPFGCW